MKLSAKTFFSVRSHLIPDATKSSFQSVIENVRDKTRQFLGIFRKKPNNLSSDSCRQQYRLPVEYFPNASIPPLLPKYQPGFIHRITSRWVLNSLAKKANANALRRSRGPMLCFVGFALARKPSLLTADEEIEGVSFAIREAFSCVPWQINRSNILQKLASENDFTLENLKIGEMIAKGSYAAVHHASLNLDKLGCVESENFNQKEIYLSDNSKVNSITNSKVIISHFEGEQNINTGDLEAEITNDESSILSKQFGSNDFAIKVMYNYSAESNAYSIFHAMYRETLPAISETFIDEKFKRKIRKKRLNPHPNIVEMYFAFANRLPLLPGALKNYPQALPQRLLSDGYGRNMTLFLVMKRYHCNLKEYLKKNVSSHTSLLLLTQLLEAISYLLQNDITHRDLKADNILLDLSSGLHSPKLVITDFGCCLENLKIAYHSENVGKDGNLALMAPEIINAEPGPLAVLDYSRADLWTAGTLAYEIYGEKNPFYSGLQSDSYDLKSLPPLPSKMPTTVQKLVRDMLQKDPYQRPSPSFAATVCQLLLHAPSELLKSQPSNTSRRETVEWMLKMSAQAYLEVSLKNPEEYSVGLQLKHTFCSRIQYLEIVRALEYIAE